MTRRRAREENHPASVSAQSRRTAWVPFLVTVIVFTLAMMLVSFPTGLYTVFGTNLSGSIGPSTEVKGLDLDLVFATVLLPIATNLGTFFVAVSAIYLFFLLVAARQGAGLLRAIRESVAGGYQALFTNPLAAMMVLLGATSFMTQLLDSLQTNVGIATGSLSGDPFVLFLSFTLAPLLEETTFRLIMIGVPILILGLIILREFSPEKVLGALWRPSSLWDVDEDEAGEVVHTFEDADPSLFPGNPSDSLKVRAIKPVVLVFLVLSSIIFGYGHYSSGSGWGIGKISEAALAGLALGYLYIKYGFATNVLLHWSINYVGSAYSFLATGLYGIPWNSTTGSPLDIVPTVVVVYLLGIPSTFIVAKELLSRRSTGGPS